MALVSVAAVAACGANPAEPDEVSSTESALISCGSGCQEFTDGTGSIHVRVRTCATVTSTGTNGSQQAQARCPNLSSTIDGDWNAGYVMVGGGAEIIGSPVPGALLKTSMPELHALLRNSAIPTQWLAVSGQYTTGAAHSLRAYSIGLRLVGMTADELSNGANFIVADGQSGFENPFTQIIPPAYIVVGGGATAFDTPNPMFLTESEPDFNGHGWRAEAHTAGNLADTNTPKAVSIGLVNCPVHANGTQWGCLWQATQGVWQGHLSGYQSMQTYDTSSPPAAMTSVGGQATSTTEGAKRFLTDLIPVATINGVPRESVTVSSKDTFMPANGILSVTMLELGKF